MTEEQIRTFRLHPDRRIPEHMIGALLRYFNEHILPGGFLQALLEDRFLEACRRADNENFEALQVWASFLYSVSPKHSFGSPEKVEAWVNPR